MDENSNNEKEKNVELPSCCKKPAGEKPKGLLQGILYGLIPHIGCIAFILASVFGLTFAASLFRPLLAKSYLFYGMIALSLVFATISAVFYLCKNGGIKTIKNHKRYLTILYGTTIAISALLYFVIFPLTAVSTASTGITGAAIANAGNTNSITLEVAIPCPGHASLITGDLNTLAGIIKVEYSPVKTFKVYYDPSKTTKQKILSLDIFKEYKATVISEENSANTLTNTETANVEKTSATSSGGCGCGSSCGGGSCCSR